MSNTRDRKKLLLLTQDLQLRGAQRQLVELALGLDRNRYDIQIGTLEPSGPLAQDLLSSGLPVISFARSWRWDLTPILRLATHMRQERIDIVHAFDFLPNFYSRFAGRFARTHLIVSSMRGIVIEGWHRHLLDVTTCFMCHTFITNSEAGRTRYVGRGGSLRKFVVIKNGINPARFSCINDVHHYRRQWDLSRFDRIIGMVAAMEESKDQGLLIQAIKVIIHHKPRTGLLLVGDGSQRATLESFTRAEGLQSHVVFTGQVRMPEEVYPLFDIYVQASRREGISNSILEAMSCSLPVVATDVGGNGEVVVDRVTGFVVPAGKKDDLVHALLVLLNDPQRCTQMGQAGLARVRKEFSLEGMVAATQSLYETVSDHRCQRRRNTLNTPSRGR